LSRTGSQPISFQWQEEDQANLGEGISRAPAGAKTQLFALLVKHPRAMPMRVTMRAENKAAALRYAANCWPSAEVSLQPAEKRKKGARRVES
jgi:hypothetical protein